MDQKDFTVEHLSRKQLRQFFSKVSINSNVSWNGTPCWVWTGYITPKGYGNFKWGKTTLTHRLAYAWLIGPIPRGHKIRTLDHLCRNRACCNPIHLELVPMRVNVLRGIGPIPENAKKTHCIHGHPLSGDNLIYRKEGRKSRFPSRRCFICYKKKQKRANEKEKTRYQSDPAFRAKINQQARSRYRQHN